ncbi:MAG TPA: AmmeMemoRadiSam system protein A [Candidatus Acidoferrum sp.]|jgi:AmmeMemoRadiSam system protein A
MQCLSEEERNDVLALARQALTEAICDGRLLAPFPTDGIFSTRCGVFVTLHVCGKLRGCIGVIDGREPLGESIVRCTASAALQDPRFAQMQPEEVTESEIEVSLLSPLQRILPEHIEVGKHGLVVEQGPRRGLLLPQVALEHHLDRERFLEETCHKAGLARDAWKNPETAIFGFTCEIVTRQK